MLEIAVQRKNIARIQLVSHVDQAGIGKVAWCVSVLRVVRENFVHTVCQLKGNFQLTTSNTGQNRLWRAWQSPKKLNCLRDDRLTGDKRSIDLIKRRHTLQMVRLLLVVYADQEAGIHKYGQR